MIKHYDVRKLFLPKSELEMLKTNPILEDGEFVVVECIEGSKDKHKIKIGNGKRYVDTPFANKKENNNERFNGCKSI